MAESRLGDFKTLFREKPVWHVNEIRERLGVSRQHVYRLRDELYSREGVALEAAIRDDDGSLLPSDQVKPGYLKWPEATPLEDDVSFSLSKLELAELREAVLAWAQGVIGAHSQAFSFPRTRCSSGKSGGELACTVCHEIAVLKPRYFMHHDVAKAAYLVPGDVGVSRLKVGRDMPSGLTDHGHVADDRIPRFLIRGKGRLIHSGSVAGDAPNSLEDVLDAHEPVSRQRERSRPECALGVTVSGRLRSPDRPSSPSASPGNLSVRGIQKDTRVSRSAPARRHCCCLWPHRGQRSRKGERRYPELMRRFAGALEMFDSIMTIHSSGKTFEQNLGGSI